MSPRFVLGRENVPCVAEVVNRSLKADCTDFTLWCSLFRRTVLKMIYVILIVVELTNAFVVYNTLLCSVVLKNDLCYDSYC